MKHEEPMRNINPFGLRLQPELKAKLEEAARQNKRSLNAEISARLESTFHLDHIRPANLISVTNEENATGIFARGALDRAAGSLTDLEELQLNVEIVLEQVRQLKADPALKPQRLSEPTLDAEPRPRRITRTRKKPTE